MHAILQTQILGSGMQMEIHQTFFYLNRHEPWLLTLAKTKIIYPKNVRAQVAMNFT